MAATAVHKKKKAPKESAPKTPAPKDDLTAFGQPIETDKIKVEFDIPALKVTYTLKTSGDVLFKTYAKVHALMIIHGRIMSQPHGEYTQQCVAKARIAMMKQMKLD